MKTISYSVANMSCGHCVHTIQTEIKDLSGVKDVIAELANKKVTVTFDEPATEEGIKALLAEINYPVQG